VLHKIDRQQVDHPQREQSRASGCPVTGHSKFEKYPSISKNALSDFYPIPAGLNGLSQCFLFSEHGGCFQNLEIQVATIQAEKSIR
jgi:hypothetical protein